MDPEYPNEGRRTLFGPTEGNTQAKGTGGQEKRMDLGGHMETYQQDSLRT